MRVNLLVTLAVLLAGCASAPPSQAPPPPDPDSLTEWTATGRLAVAAGEQGGSGSFVWSQAGESATLHLRGPLGAGGLVIETDGRVLRLAEGNGRIVDSESARQELRRRLGADLPLANLRYWMLGVPAPGSEARVLLGQRPPLRVIEQSGWTVGIDAFRSVAGFSLPVRLTATAEQARIKVVVSQWDLGPGAGPGQGP
ncbi:MAG TPA: lipoprotein insertase outer membrane protein LolB [Steroidobacteraceae bacterium]|nr:lipoprotein insertase outer membrane protein LolB [Steroidobacteraceae bacterium]